MSSYFAEIENDLDWREAELAIFRIQLSENDRSPKVRRVFIRSAWALLYAHFEGFCKFALTAYYDEIRHRGLRCCDLPASLRDFALDSQLRRLKNLPRDEAIDAILEFSTVHLVATPTFPEVETDSNLSSKKLADLLSCADIKLSSLEDHGRKIDTLVSRRNKIAHGEREQIDEVAYYLTFEDAAKMVMYDLALSIDARIDDLSGSPGRTSTLGLP